MGQLLLTEAVQEVALILLGVAAAQEAIAGRALLAGGGDPRVVACGDRIAVVQKPCLSQKRSELDHSVAVHAWARRAATQVCGKERLQDSRVEFALQVHHEERDIQLRRYAPRILGGVQ